MRIANTLVMMRVQRNFLAEESAVTAIDYVLIAGITAIVIVTAVGNTGRTLTAFFMKLSAAL